MRVDLNLNRMTEFIMPCKIDEELNERGFDSHLAIGFCFAKNSIFILHTIKVLTCLLTVIN